MFKFLDYKAKYNSFFLVLILVSFAIVFSLVSLPNHYNFRTHALDLGLNNNALYNFIRGNEVNFTLDVSDKTLPFLATHFTLLMFVFSPFIFLFGTSTLLIFQILAILFGGIYIYKLAKLYFKNSYLPHLILIHFFLIWGIYSALSFDYHNNVVGCMFFPAILFYIEKRKLLASFILTSCSLLCIETMSIYLFFILLCLIFVHYKKRKVVAFELPLLVYVVIYGIVVISFVMPYLQENDTNLQLNRYTLFGTNFTEILRLFFTRPLHFLSIVFLHYNANPILAGIKPETMLHFLLAGGFLILFKPKLILLFIPVFFLKFMSNDFVFWGINLQYSIEFAPLLSISLIFILKDYNFLNKRILNIVVLLLIPLCFQANYSSLFERKSLWYIKENNNFLIPEHYTSLVDVNNTKKALKKYIKRDDKVSCSSSLSPHLSFRQKIYLFPNIHDANKIVLWKNIDYYPLNQETFEIELNKLRKHHNFKVEFENSNLIIFKKINEL